MLATPLEVRPAQPCAASVLQVCCKCSAPGLGPQVRRPEFVGREVVSEITGEVELVEGRGSRALRYAASLCVSLACLIVPLAYMFVSLNLQDSL